MKQWEHISERLSEASASAESIDRLKNLYHEPEFQSLIKAQGRSPEQNKVAPSCAREREYQPAKSDELVDKILSGHKVAKSTINQLSPDQLAQLPEEVLLRLSASCSSAHDGQVDDIVFSLSSIVQTGFPHRKIKGKQHYTRKNGRLTVTMAAPDEIGLPFGVSARILFIYLCTAIVKSNAKKLFLGQSLNKFIRNELKVPIVKGERGSTSTYKKAFISLLGTNITAHEKLDNKDSECTGINLVSARISSKAHLWWDKDNTANTSPSMKGYVEFSEEFFQAVTKHSAPLLSSTILELAKHNSPFALDVYCWLTYRFHNMCARNETSFLYIKWKELFEQLGSGYSKLHHFRSAFRAALKLVKEVYPDANFIADRDDLLILIKSKPQVEAKPAVQQTIEMEY